MSITVLTVSWNSAEFLQGLIKNLLAKAGSPDSLHFLVIDNSNGLETELLNLKSITDSLKIMPHDVGDLKNLSAHASALNYGFNHVDTDFILVIDPDVHVFKKGWDTFLIEEIRKKQLDTIGTAYPPWWLGTYHNFPSPIFCFSKTSSLQKIDADWMPPQKKLSLKTLHFISRQILRGGFAFNRRSLLKVDWLRQFSAALEALLPVCSIDTGYPLSIQERIGNIKAQLFQAIYPNNPLLMQRESEKLHLLLELVSQYEVYAYNSEIILTHQYGSQNFLLKTHKGSDTEYWKTLTNKIEISDLVN